MGLSVAVGAWIGGWLDERFGTDPWCAGVGLLVGISAAFRSLFLLRGRVMRRLGEDDDVDQESTRAEEHLERNHDGDPE